MQVDDLKLGENDVAVRVWPSSESEVSEHGVRRVSGLHLVDELEVVGEVVKEELVVVGVHKLKRSQTDESTVEDGELVFCQQEHFVLHLFQVGLVQEM